MKKTMGKKYPKFCPACGTRSIIKDDKYGFRCKKCSFVNLRKIPWGKIHDFVTYGGKL